MNAGQLSQRVAFQRRAAIDDGYGNTVSGEWADQFETAAGFTFLRGGESVMAARLAGRQPLTIRVRNYSLTRRVEVSDRIRDVRVGELYNIRAITPTSDGAFLDILAEGGVAT